jgi:hypothetical protein
MHFLLIAFLVIENLQVEEKFIKCFEMTIDNHQHNRTFLTFCGKQMIFEKQ